MLQSRIALVDVNGRLCTCDPDGGNFHVLTRRDRIYQFPAWSPDGTWIAAVGSDRAGSGVYVFGNSSHEPQWQLYRSSTGDRKSPFYLYWSPDSRQVSFIANHPSDGIGFHIVPCEPHAVSRLVATGQPFFWQWGRNSAEIILHAGMGDASGRFAMLDLENLPQRISNHAPPGYFQAPGYSPDGRYIAYASLDDAQTSSVVIERRTSGTQVKQPHAGAAALTWSPRRNILAYMAPNNRNAHFYGPLTLLSPNGKRRTVARDSIFGFFWSPDGNKIAYFAPTQDEFSFRLSGPSYRNGDNRYHPDRAKPHSAESAPRQEAMLLDVWIIDLRLNSRIKLATYRPTRLFVNQFLPFFDQYALSHRIWSSASDAIVLPMLNDGKSEITVLPIDQSEKTVIAEGYSAFWNAGG